MAPVGSASMACWDCLGHLLLRRAQAAGAAAPVGTACSTLEPRPQTPSLCRSAVERSQGPAASPLRCQPVTWAGVSAAALGFGKLAQSGCTVQGCLASGYRGRSDSRAAGYGGCARLLSARPFSGRHRWLKARDGQAGDASAAAWERGATGSPSTLPQPPLLPMVTRGVAGGSAALPPQRGSARGCPARERQQLRRAWSERASASPPAARLHPLTAPRAAPAPRQTLRGRQRCTRDLLLRR